MNSSLDDEWDALFYHRAQFLDDVVLNFKIVAQFKKITRLNFNDCFRMDISTFDYILNTVKDDSKIYSNFRSCIEPEEKLAVFLG